MSGLERCPWWHAIALLSALAVMTTCGGESTPDGDAAGSGAAGLTAEQASMQSVQAPTGAGTTDSLSVVAWVDRPDDTYAFGERVRLYVQTNQDAYVTVINVAPDGATTVLFPNRFQADNRVRANTITEIPDPSSQVRIAVSGPAGAELIKVIASNQPVPLFDTLQMVDVSAFQSVRGMTDDVARSLAVVMESEEATEWDVYDKVLQTVPGQPQMTAEAAGSFGDDSGAYPDDGECDDGRFTGQGMGVESEVRRDASDCRRLLNAGRIRWRTDADAPVAAAARVERPRPQPQMTAEAAGSFGDDSGAYPNDGECDDGRFTGQGMGAESEVRRDASDCRRLLNAGRIRWRTDADAPVATAARVERPRPQAQPTAEAAGSFGDDSGSYPNDGECDDGRFTGQGMGAESEVRRDASDCRRLLNAGRIRWRTDADAPVATAARVERPRPQAQPAAPAARPTATTAPVARVERPRPQAQPTTPAARPPAATAPVARVEEPRPQAQPTQPDADEWEDTVTGGLLGVAGALAGGASAEDALIGGFIGGAAEGNTDDAATAGLLGSALMGSDASVAQAVAGEIFGGSVSGGGGGFGGLGGLFRGIGVSGFGDDSGLYPNNSKCDDGRFAGKGMGAVSEIGKDASDCRRLLNARRIRWRKR